MNNLGNNPHYGQDSTQLSRPRLERQCEFDHIKAGPYANLCTQRYNNYVFPEDARIANLIAQGRLTNPRYLPSRL